MKGARQSMSKEGDKRAGSRNVKELGRLGRYLKPYRLQVALTLVALWCWRRQRFSPSAPVFAI